MVALLSMFERLHLPLSTCAVPASPLPPLGALQRVVKSSHRPLALPAPQSQVRVELQMYSMHTMTRAVHKGSQGYGDIKPMCTYVWVCERER